jgi:hypothetical protein
MLQWADMVKFIKSLRLKWYGHTERTNNKRMPKQIVIVRMEGIRKRRQSTEKIN